MSSHHLRHTLRITTRVLTIAAIPFQYLQCAPNVPPMPGRVTKWTFEGHLEDWSMRHISIQWYTTHQGCTPRPAPWGGEKVWPALPCENYQNLWGAAGQS